MEQTRHSVEGQTWLITGARGHPRLNEALENYVNNYLNIFAQSPQITKLASEDIKYMLALKAAELCTHPTGPPFTKAQIQAFAPDHKIATPNRVS